MLKYICIALISFLSCNHNDQTTIRTGWVFKNNLSDSCLVDKKIINNDGSYKYLIYRNWDCEDSIFMEQDFLSDDRIKREVSYMGGFTFISDIEYDEFKNLKFIKKIIKEDPLKKQLNQYLNSYDVKDRLVKSISKVNEKITEIKIIVYDSLGYSKIEKLYDPSNVQKVAAAIFYKIDKPVKKSFYDNEGKIFTEEIWKYLSNGKLIEFFSIHEKKEYSYDEDFNLKEEKKYAGKNPNFKLIEVINYFYEGKKLIHKTITKFNPKNEPFENELIKYYYK